jgi:hypothetical protein
MILKKLLACSFACLMADGNGLMLACALRPACFAAAQLAFQQLRGAAAAAVQQSRMPLW